MFRSKSYEFNPIKLENFNKNFKQTALVHNKMGTFDMEVFIRNHESIIYNLGFYSYLDKNPNIFYINKELDSTSNVIKCFNEMFKAKYKDITWYCHNSGRYDSRILLKTLYQYNYYIKTINDRKIEYNKVVTSYNRNVLKHNFMLNENIIKDADKFVFTNNNISTYNNKVIKFNNKIICSSTESLMLMMLEKEIDNSKLLGINTTFRKSTLLKLEVTKIVGKTKYKINICDSCAIFPDSLKSLAEKYKVDTLKGDFPHRFANENSIFYVGNTPDYAYYNSMNKEDYDRSLSNNWDFKNEY